MSGVLTRMGVLGHDCGAGSVDRPTPRSATEPGKHTHTGSCCMDRLHPGIFGWGPNPQALAGGGRGSFWEVVRSRGRSLHLEISALMRKTPQRSPLFCV